jgi:hypothetical protein
VGFVNLILLILIHDLVYAEFCRFLRWLRPTVNETIHTQPAVQPPIRMLLLF